MIAIFSMMLIINRQTGSLFEEMILYLMPIPLTAYAVKYDWKSSIPVMIAMVLMSVLFGTLTTIFYAVTECLIGLVFGTCLYHKVESTRTLFTVILMSVIATVLNTIVLASFFGFDLERDIAELQTMLEETMKISGMVMPEQLLSHSFLCQMMVISMIILGIIQGYVVYTLTLLILKRLGFQVSRPQSVYTYQPPKWVALLALICFLAYMLTGTGTITFRDVSISNFIQAAGLCGYFFLIFFGMLYVMIYLKNAGLRAKALRIVLVAAFTMLFPLGEAAIGALYLLTDKRRAELYRN